MIVPLVFFDRQTDRHAGQGGACFCNRVTCAPKRSSIGFIILLLAEVGSKGMMMTEQPSSTVLQAHFCEPGAGCRFGCPRSGPERMAESQSWLLVCCCGDFWRNLLLGRMWRCVRAYTRVCWRRHGRCCSSSGNNECGRGRSRLLCATPDLIFEEGQEWQTSTPGNSLSGRPRLAIVAALGTQQLHQPRSSMAVEWTRHFE